MSFKKTAILIIRGISLNEILTIDVKPVKQVMEYNYSDIPRKFTSVKEWPTFTNILCWYCSLSITGYPKFVPKNPSIIKGQPVCETIGHFCHWSCAISYALIKYDTEKFWDVEKMIIIFANLFNDFKYQCIPEAPDFTKMKAYSGNDGMSVSEYQELMNTNLLQYNK